LAPEADMSPDLQVVRDDWSLLARHRPMPVIDHDRMHRDRLGRLRRELARQDCAMGLLVNPISHRYAVDYRCYALFQAHIPTAYLFFGQEGPTVLHGVYGHHHRADSVQPGRPISVFDGGLDLRDAAAALAQDVVDYLSELGTDNRRVAVEYVNPTLIQALERRGLEVVDGVAIAEEARRIKSLDEIACIRWACAVAEHAITNMVPAIRPGVTESQLWGLLNYTNMANNGDWHDGRMLASGPNTNPWCQDAGERVVEDGDLVAFDTDMIGPNGYFADISRTVVCGGRATRAQKRLYRLAVQEIEHNLRLIRPGVSLTDFQARAYVPDEAFHQEAYTVVIHAVGMCDEAPKVTPIFRGPTPYDGMLEENMVLCVESYMGEAGGAEGVKLEQQVLVTADGYELLSTLPWDAALLD